MLEHVQATWIPFEMTAFLRIACLNFSFSIHDASQAEAFAILSQRTCEQSSNVQVQLQTMWSNINGSNGCTMRHGTMLRMKREHHEKLEAERTRRVGSSNLQHFATIEKVQRTLEPDARCIPNFKELYLFDLLTTSELSRTFVAFSVLLMASKLSYSLTKQGANERGARKATKRGRLKGFLLKVNYSGLSTSITTPWGMHPRSHIFFLRFGLDQLLEPTETVEICWIVAFQANRLEKERQRQRRVAVEAGEASEASAWPGCEFHGDSQLKRSMN